MAYGYVNNAIQTHKITFSAQIGQLVKIRAHSLPKTEYTTAQYELIYRSILVCLHSVLLRFFLR